MTNATSETSSGESSEHELNPSSPILFLFLILILGSLTNQMLKIVKATSGLRLPYSVGLICIGLILGTILYQSLNCEHKESYSCINNIGIGTNGQFQESMLMWMNIPGELILFIFLPPLIYEGSAYTNVYKFSKHFASGVVLAGPGVIIQTALIGSCAKYIFPYDWNWVESLLFGGILSATDPIAVIALLKELGCLPDLRVLIEAESVLNDGTAIVVFQLCYYILTAPRGSASDYVQDAFQLSLGGPAIGILFCIGTMGILSTLHNPLLETTVTIAAAYLCFFTAQGSILVSGVLAVMTLGVLLSMYGQSVISHEARHFLHVFWGMVEFMANTVIFILAGAIIMFDAFLLRSDIFTASDWGYLFLNYVLLFFIRLVMLLICGPYLRLFGYRLTSKHCSLWDFIKCMVFAAWGGLRGVVGMSLGLIVYNDGKIADKASDPAYPDRVLFHVCGLVALTLLINGPTTEYVISMLGLDAKKTAEQQHLEAVAAKQTTSLIKLHLMDEYLAVKKIRQVSENNQVDWESVRKLIGLASEETQYSVPKNHPMEPVNECSVRNLRQQTSIRYYQLCLEGVKASYEEQFASHLIGGQAFRTLELAINCADDFIQTQMIQRVAPTHSQHNFRWFDVGWIRGLLVEKPDPWYLRLFDCFPASLRQRLVDKHLIFQIETALAVLDAYKELQEMLTSAVSDSQDLLSEIAEILLLVQLRLAKLQCMSPRLCATINSKRVAIALLKLSRQEIVRLHDEFQMSDAEFEHLSHEYKLMARQVRYGHHVIAPISPRELARNEPLFKVLTFEHFDRVWQSISKHPRRFAKGSTIFEHNQRPDGVLVFVSGFATVMAEEGDGKFVRICTPGNAEGDGQWLLHRSGLSVLNTHAVVAGSEVEAFHLTHEALKDMVEECPAMLQELWRARARAVLGTYPAELKAHFDDVDSAATMLESAVLKTFGEGATHEVTEHALLLITGSATAEPAAADAKSSTAREAVRGLGLVRAGQRSRFHDACNHVLALPAPAAAPPVGVPAASTLKRQDSGGSLRSLQTSESDREVSSGVHTQMVRLDGLGEGSGPFLQRSASHRDMHALVGAARREARTEKMLSIVDLPI